MSDKILDAYAEDVKEAKCDDYGCDMLRVIDAYEAERAARIKAEVELDSFIKEGTPDAVQHLTTRAVRAEEEASRLRSALTSISVGCTGDPSVEVEFMRGVAQAALSVNHKDTLLSPDEVRGALRQSAKGANELLKRVRTTRPRIYLTEE